MSYREAIISIPEGAGSGLQTILITKEMRRGELKNAKGQSDQLPEQTSLLIEQTRIALSERLQANNYLVMDDKGIVLDTPNGSEANKFFKAISSQGHEAFLIGPNITFLLDAKGKTFLTSAIIKSIENMTGKAINDALYGDRKENLYDQID